MIEWLRFASTLVSVAFHVLLGLALAALAFPFIGRAGEQRVIRWWSQRLLTIVGLRVRVVHRSPKATREAQTIAAALHPGGPAAMLILNHVSWLDIFVVHAMRPAHFVAKAEISRWPLLGFLVARTGTIFIERGKRHAVRDINHRVGTLLEDGGLVALFPEGTTSDGNRLLPFHANLIQPAITAGAPVVVAGIRYRDLRGGPTSATLYVGDTTLFQSLLRLARHGPLTAELHLIDVLDSAGKTRHEIGRSARASIADALHFGDASEEIDEGMSIIVVPRVNRESAPSDRGPGTPLDPRDELL